MKIFKNIELLNCIQINNPNRARFHSREHFHLGIRPAYRRRPRPRLSFHISIASVPLPSAAAKASQLKLAFLTLHRTSEYGVQMCGFRDRVRDRKGERERAHTCSDETDWSSPVQ